MVTNDDWLDEVLSKTEKQEIKERIKLAIGRIENLRIDEALLFLKALYHDLDDHIEESVEKLLTDIESMPQPKYWSQPHVHKLTDGHSHTASGTYTAPVPNYDEDIISEIQTIREELLKMQKKHEQQVIEERMLAFEEDAEAEPFKEYIKAIRDGRW